MSGRSEIGLGFACYSAYLLARRHAMADDGPDRALRNAEAIRKAEADLGLRIEPALQRHVARGPGLVKALSAGYLVANIGLTVGWLIVLYRREDPRYLSERRAAMLAFLGALPVFAAFPTAPPRALEESERTAWQGIDLDHPALLRFYNPIAAMPSHHAAFATVTGLGLAAGDGRAVWRTYPAAVGWMVMATGNHYAADVAAGALLGWIAHRLTR